MLKSIIKTFGLIAGLAFSGVVCAMGIGGISVVTSLGEPLKAEIELIEVGKEEKNSLSAHLASPEAFKGAGIDYPSNLPKLKFQLESRANGEHYLKVTSVQPVNEPFVSILVELTWSSGRLMREYTFLLDPPNYKPELPKAAEVEPVLPRNIAAPRNIATPSEIPAPSNIHAPSNISAPSEKAVPSDRPAPRVAAAPRYVAAPTEKKIADTSASDRKPVENRIVASGDIKVKRGDTLSEIALQAKPSGVSLERMLVAMYRTNADAFDGNNMNRLKTGKILQMPGSDVLEKLSQAEAAKEFRVQVADWHAYRQKLAAVSGAVSDHAPTQEASGKISTTVADRTPAAKESAKEVVRLSKGEAPGDKAVAAGDAKTLQGKVHSMEEESIAKSKALKESKERIGMLEQNNKEMQRLVELWKKGQPSALAKPAEVKPTPKPEHAKVEAKQPMTASAVAPVAALQTPLAASAVMAASTVAHASAEKPVKAATKPVTPPPPPSMLDEPLYLVGGAAVLLALGGLGLVLFRRAKGGRVEKNIPDSSEGAVEVSADRFSTPVAPSPETGDFTQAESATLISSVQLDDVDPINEADLFLSFGRDAQAEEILKDALEKNPANNQIRLKLLSIYANRKDTQSFSVIARQTQDSGDTEAWASAAEMGRNLEPNNPMYGGMGGEPIIATPDQGKSKQPPIAELDLDLGLIDSSAPATSAIADFESAMVPDELEGEKPNKQLEDLYAAPEVQVDFDVTDERQNLVAPESEQASAAMPNLDDLIFDISSTSPAVAANAEAKPTADNSVSTGDALAFTLDFPVADKTGTAPAPTTAKEAVDFDLSRISLDMGNTEAPVPASAPAAEAKDAHWYDVATKLDLAKAYQEMGDNAGAREILEEVLAEGDDQQRAVAEEALQQLLA